MTSSTRSIGTISVLFAALVVAACGGGPMATSLTPNAAVSATPSPAASSVPSMSPAATPTSGPSPAPAAVRLVIQDYLQPEVRLARLDAVDTARVKGEYDGIVADRALVVNGTTLEAIAANGSVRTIGHLKAAPMWTGPGTVAVKPDFSQWLYTVTDSSLTSFIHLGTPASDRIVATVKSPDGYSFYPAFEWNASGVYMLHQPTGLGGAGPFLDYHFPLVTIDLATAKLTEVAPSCVAYTVLDDGTYICKSSTPGDIEVRSPSGQSRLIHVTIGTANSDAAFIQVSVSPDGKRIVVGRDGSKDPTINYQMAVAPVTASTAAAFGPIDFLPNAWLPDGRVVATHQCAYADWGGGPCSASLDGTYIVSADGGSKTLFYKLSNAAVVGYI